MCISLGIIPVVYVLRVEDKIIYFFLKLCVKRTKKSLCFDSLLRSVFIKNID